MSDLKLGKKAPTYDKRDWTYAELRAAVTLPKFPNPSGGYGMDFGSSNWRMLGNGPDDTVFQGFGGCGDCAWAGPAHETMEMAYNARGPIPPFSGKTVVDQYSAYCGYDPKSGNNDNGSVVRDVLNWRRTKGLLDDNGTAHKIGAFVSLEPGNLQQLWEALWLFESVGIGIEFPGSAMDQFNNNNQIWSVVPGAQIEGGHYVPLVGHPTNDVWTCITWAARQTITPQFLTKYCDEAWAYVSPELFNKVTGKSQQSFTQADLEQFIAQFGQVQLGGK